MRDRTGTVVVLFTRDLRVHDNPGLYAAAKHGAQVVPLFVLDDAFSTATTTGRTALAFWPRACRTSIPHWPSSVRSW